MSGLGGNMGGRKPLQLDFDRRAPTRRKSPSQPMPSNPIEEHKLGTEGTLTINSKNYKFVATDLIDEGEIGRGAYGSVNKMLHEESKTLMGVKRIRAEVDGLEQRRLLMDLDVVIKSRCEYIVKFYGAVFHEGDAWICMELMTISLDKFSRLVNCNMKQSLPENFLGKVAVAIVEALNYLKTELNIIHRDVKPSNILLVENGNIKLCDFGISGKLVDSIAKTRDAGCRPYMAPERINPETARDGYDVRSDVWSLGITLVELATGKFPYPQWKTIFEQLSQVVSGPAPRLRNTPDGQFSEEFISFVHSCLVKDVDMRPKYGAIMEHPFIRKYVSANVDVAKYVQSIISHTRYRLSTLSPEAINK